MSNSCAIAKADVVELAKPLLMDFSIRCQIMVTYTSLGIESNLIYRSDGRVDRASASGLVDLGVRF